MARGIDYGALAAQLRDVNRRITARTDASPPQDGVALSDVLDLLTSDQAPELLASLTEQAEQAVQATRARLAEAGERTILGATLRADRTQDSFYPDEPFARRLAQFFGSQEPLLTPAHADPELVPAAVVDALCTPGNRTGFLTRAEAARLGPQALKLFDRLQTSLSGGTPKSARPASKYEGLSTTQAWRVARSRATHPAKDRMPVLDEITRMMGGPDALAGLQMASVQHLFPSTRGLFAALADNGLRAGTTGVGGKGYSTDIDTMARLAAEGFNVHRDGRPMAFRAGESAEAVTLQMAKDQLGLLFRNADPKSQGPQFLLLDEGAKLIHALHLHYPQFAHLCVCVEQTERGIQIVQDAEARGEYKLLCPVVDMARSEAKKRWESPMIGESCVYNLEEDLESMAPGLHQHLFSEPERRTACVIGYGAVGQAVADRLRARGFEVHVHDTDPERMAQAQQDGCVAGTRARALAHGHLLYSCTGRGGLSPEDFEALPDHAVLANAASGNHELGLHDLDVNQDPEERTSGVRSRTSFAGHSLDLGESDDPMRHRVWRTPGGKSLLMARSGYVVNMGLDLPPEYAQLTRGLLLASCLTAAKSRGAGFVPIPKAAQDFIVKRVQKHLGPGRLKAPDFRSLAG